MMQDFCTDCGGPRSPSSGGRCLACFQASKVAIPDDYVAGILRRELETVRAGEQALRTLAERWRTTYPVGLSECEKIAAEFADKVRAIKSAMRAAA